MEAFWGSGSNAMCMALILVQCHFVAISAAAVHCAVPSGADLRSLPQCKASM